jgi:glycosyltransferase involved in cell wall biosynthesis
MAPKLSIRIPTLNNYKGLLRALENIIVQDFDDKDIIIVDNDSDDGSWALTRTLPGKYPSVQILRNTQRGLAENWNYCIKSATGKYVLIFHTDDIMLPGMLSKSVDFLDKNPSVGLVHSNCYDINERGKAVVRVTGLKPILIKGSEALIKIASDCNIACSTVVVRKECYDKLGVFKTGNPTPDPEMWARIVTQYDMGHINEPLVKVIAHIDSFGRAAISKLPPAAIEEQWNSIGNQIISYFPPEDKPTAIRISKGSRFDALSAAAYLAWCQKRWFRGHQFMLLAKRYTSFSHWIVMYFKILLWSMKSVIFKNKRLNNE